MIERILIVNVNWLGDAILTTPVFKALKQEFPCSYIGVMVVERVREVFTENPYIDEIIVFDEKKCQKSLINKIKFIFFLKRKRFDTAFLIHRSFTKSFICFLAGIKRRIGYKRLKNQFIINKRISRPSRDIHRQDSYLHLFESSGITIENKLPQFFISEGTREKMLNGLSFLREKHPYIVGINPSANWELKRWPASYFSKLADFLIKSLNCAIILIGAEKEKNVVREVMKNTHGKAYNFCGKTSLKELGALMENMDIFISNDSGPAHMAASLGINTLVLFGPTSDALTSPKGEFVKIIKKETGCEVPCYNLECDDNRCMKGISVEEVSSYVKSILLRTDYK